jgi:hypothetical protein
MVWPSPRPLVNSLPLLWSVEAVWIRLSPKSTTHPKLLCLSKLDSRNDLGRFLFNLKVENGELILPSENLRNQESSGSSLIVAWSKQLHG